MDKFERLVDLGLSAEEATLITTPVEKLTVEEAKAGFFVLDKRSAVIRELNKNFISSGGIHQIISKDGFEPFQNPCDTDVIITSEHQRRDEMKKHGCFDARETIPHGKTSVMHGQL